MDEAGWPMAGRALPGPLTLALWIAATVTLPLVYFEETHRWEEHQSVSTALWWTLGAMPLLAATTSARWWTDGAQRRAGWDLLTAMATGTLVGAVFLAGSLAFYRWVIPLSGTTNWWATFIGGLGLAVAGATIGSPIGYLIGAGGRNSNDESAWHGYLLGAIVAVAGALLAPMTLQLGAEDSTVSSDYGRYGGVGTDFARVDRQGVLTLPAAGRYAIYAVGFSPHDPDCRVAGPGISEQRADLIAAPPSDYGSDAATLAWVATFSVPEPGAYSLTCRTGEGPKDYAVGALIHWPLTLLWLLGSIPGLLIIVSAVRRAATGLV
jgi:hypothetical protein